MLHLRDFVIPLLAAIIVGILVWAYWDRRLRNTLLVESQTPSSQTAVHFQR
jgi:hypothetical protein